jgi:hypothetical protein
MVGLSERDRTLLRSFLAASQARTGIRWDGGASQPPVHFIDVDGQAGAEFWQSLPEGERRDAAIVISGTVPSEAARWLPKPLRSASLLGVLEQMILPARAPAAPIAAQAAVAPVAAQRAARIRDPGEPLRLLDVFEDVVAGGARTVQSGHWPDLVLGSGNTHAMRTAPLEQYIEGFAASTVVTRVAKYTGGPLNDEQRIDLDTLRWLALLHAPLGEIVRRLPRPERVRLRALPPFGHLPHTLQQVRMAAWLVQHPASPQELAEMSGIDDETALRFLAACDALGLMQEVADVAAPAAAVEAAPAPALPPVVSLVAPVPLAAPPLVTVVAPEPVPDAIIAAIDGVAGFDDTLPAVAEKPAAVDAVPPAETLSVLERLRATREQNRARVAAAIRGVSGS